MEQGNNERIETQRLDRAIEGVAPSLYSACHSTVPGKDDKAASHARQASMPRTRLASAKTTSVTAAATNDFQWPPEMSAIGPRRTLCGLMPAARPRRIPAMTGRSRSNARVQIVKRGDDEGQLAKYQGEHNVGRGKGKGEWPTPSLPALRRS